MSFVNSPGPKVSTGSLLLVKLGLERTVLEGGSVARDPAKIQKHRVNGAFMAKNGKSSLRDLERLIGANFASEADTTDTWC
jgi:hypothetical protein